MLSIEMGSQRKPVQVQWLRLEMFSIKGLNEQFYLMLLAKNRVEKNKSEVMEEAVCIGGDAIIVADDDAIFYTGTIFVCC